MIDFNQFFDSNVSEGINTIISDLQNLRKELNAIASDTKKQISLINPNDQKAIEQAIQDVEELTKAKEDLDKQEKAAIRTKKRLEDLTNEELIQLQEQKIQARERNQLAKQEAIIRRSQVGSIERLRAQLSKTTLEWKKLSDNERENTDEGKKLVKRKLELTNQLKKLEKQTGDTRRNVGNYTEALSALAATSNPVSRGIAAVNGAFKLLSANPIVLFVTALVTGLTAIFKAFANTKRGAEFFARASEGLNAVLSVFTDILANVAEALIAVFSDPLGALRDLSTAIQNNIINRFTGIIELARAVGSALSAAFSLDLDGITEAAGEAATALTQITTGLDADQQRAFRESIASTTEEINREARAAIRLRRVLQLLTDAQRELSVERAQQNADLVKSRAAARDENKTLEERIGILRDIARQEEDLLRREITAQRLRIVQLEALDAQSSTSEQVQNELAQERIKLAQLTAKSYSNEIALQRELDRLEKQRAKQAAAERKSQQEFNKNITVNNQKRIKSIQELQAQITKLEIDGLDDRKEQLLRLEDLRIQAEKQQRQQDLSDFSKLLDERTRLIVAKYGEGSEEAQKAVKENRDELLKAQSITQQLEAQQLIASEQRKAKIREEFALKSAEVKPITLDDLVDIDSGQITAEIDASINEINRFEEQRQKAEATRRKNTEQLLSDIQKTSQKIGEELIKIFDKQSELAGKLVEDQSESVERQRKRAEQGLENTLAFEQEQLRKREAEQVRAEKRAEQAAKLLTLFNLVSAYAASGDTNALARGLVDFALLEALSAGFKEGGYTGDSRTDSVVGHVHGQEYVVTASDTKKFGLVGKSGEDFSSTMQRYFANQPITIDSVFARQASDFNNKVPAAANLDTSSLEREVVKMRKSMEKAERTQYDLERVTEQVAEITKHTTRGNMKKISRIKKRLDL